MGLARRALREGERRRETATGNEVGVGKELLVNGRSQVRAVTCHLNDDAEKRQASRRAVEENQSSVTGRSRCRGKAAARERTNDVIMLSSSSSSPSSIVKFHVTANEQI
jgi:hypothetical protein